eukprot:CAMPEP_0203904026 /NCGR_PEP_ID=MMETSP0359-20131031/45909_1 /ASSEMBLY_ACC=CAM_ASM_000338 /TAXON_ID=268821 /ORGANISM="Scrippsiella Hangoei, Strain SHTV-5" /LENGTH=65 /DNA_ID=CAMNT_0050828179 /DNA_START=51 /DNA_END=244 /DNA_ORIENTATION=+
MKKKTAEGLPPLRKHLRQFGCRQPIHEVGPTAETINQAARDLRAKPGKKGRTKRVHAAEQDDPMP